MSKMITFYKKRLNFMKTNPLATIKKRQTLFRSLTGITQEKFDELLKKTTPLYEQEETKRLHREKRKRKHDEENLTEEELLEIFIIDATEQQIRRPKKQQKKFYSGKKKKHTIKNQLTVTPNGRILTVSCSVPGSKHDKKLYDESHLTYGINTKPISDLGYFGVKGITMPNKKPK